MNQIPSILAVKNAPGVYCICNLLDGKSYVGSATNVRKRLDHHRWALRRGTHANGYLQNVWNKDGEGAFAFFTLEQCDRSDLMGREQWWMDHLRVTDRDHGYNLRPTADRKTFSRSMIEKRLATMRARGGFRHTAEAKAKIGLASIGRIKTERFRKVVSQNMARLNADPRHREKVTTAVKEANSRSIEIVDGEKVHRFTSMGEASAFLGQKPWFLYNRLTGRQQTSFGNLLIKRGQ